MIGNLIGPEIKELIAARNFAGLREVVQDFSPADIAEIISDLPEEDQAVVFRILPHDQATEVLEYLEPETQQAVLKAMGNADAARILNDMSADDRTALLEELPGAAVSRMLQLLLAEEKAIAQSLLNYPEESVGRLMTPDLLRVRDEWTVQQVLDHIRENGEDSETLHVLYVTDERGRLIDDVRIAEILLSPLDRRVADIHDNSFIALRATDDRALAVDIFKKYDRGTLPVIDSEGKLLGLVTIDDILDVAEEEATEDIQKIGGVEALDDPYMEAPLLELFRKRAVWLVVLFLGQMLTATVMGVFQKELEECADTRAFHSADHFERRQFRLASLDAHHSRDVARGDHPGGLVAGDEARDPLRVAARHDARVHRLLAHRDLVGFLRGLRPALFAHWCDGRGGRARRRALGDDFRGDAADAVAPLRDRPSHLERALRSDTRRCHGTPHLFHDSDVNSAWHGALKRAARCNRRLRRDAFRDKLRGLPVNHAIRYSPRGV
jgi:Mg2+ transporter MgtE